MDGNPNPMKPIRNFAKINDMKVVVTHLGNRYTHKIEIETASSVEDTGVFVMSDEEVFANVLHFRIRWCEWIGDKHIITINFVPHGMGTKPSAHTKASIRKGDIESPQHFRRWIEGICRMYHQQLLQKL